jgi:hypothetical protein
MGLKKFSLFYIPLNLLKDLTCQIFERFFLHLFLKLKVYLSIFLRYRFLLFLSTAVFSEFANIGAPNTIFCQQILKMTLRSGG